MKKKNTNSTRANSNKVIYVDGTFDLLHPGHLSFLRKARLLGCRKLIAGVISDDNVASYKRRPILSLQERAKMVEALSVVDDVVIDCPFNAISEEFLDAHGIELVAYGGDPKLADPLSSWASHYRAAIDRGILNIIDYSDETSTSEIIERIQRHVVTG